MKLCIFGGSFDPPHAGHLHIARAARAALHFDSVLWVPAPDPPHKDKPGTAYADRLAMVRLLIAKEAGMEASDIEARLPRPSYSLHLIRALKAERGADHDWHFLIGADNWAIIQQWHRWEEVLQEATMVVFPRTGVPLGKLPDGVLRLDLPKRDAHSTDIRAQLAKGRSLDEACLPQEIHGYVREHGLYGQPKAGAKS